MKRLRSFVAAGAAGLLTAVAAAGGAAAEPPTSGAPVFSPLSAVPGSMWQTNNVIFALAQAKGVLFVGGTFTTVRPPGAAAGTQEQVQSKLAAFDSTTGAFLGSWRPAVTGGDVYALDVSPDGNRLYVGGTFTKIDNQSKSKMAAFDISNVQSPRLMTSTEFKAATNGRVNDIESTADTVYAGGEFLTAGGQSRPLVAAFAASNGVVTSFRPVLTGSATQWYPKPFVVAMQAVNNQLIIGGMFNEVNGVSSHALGSVVTGGDGTVNTPGFTAPGILPSSYVVAATVSDGRLFVSGRDDHTGDRARLEGVMAMSATTGAVLWGSDYHRCMGDTFAVAVVQGIVWAGTHAHDCADIGGHPEANPRFYASVLGQKVDTGDQAHFYPDTTGATGTPGSLNNVRAFTTDGSTLFVGGGWLKINGKAQQNLTRFDLRSPSNPSVTPLKVKVTASSTSTGGALVSWPASTDVDNRTLTYDVYRKTESTPIATLTADSTFWSRPTLSYVDVGVPPGTSVYYKVRVSDGETSAMSFASNTVTVQAPPDNYPAAVAADSPSFYWRLDDPSGSTTAADSSGHGESGVTSNTPSFGQAGALSTGGTAANFDPIDSIATSVARSNPSSYSMELWFKTSTLFGGKLMGLGNQQSGTSSQYDRHVYMTNGGQLIFGVYIGSTVTVTTPGSYNDNAWHHVVATQDGQGMRLYVDGALAGSDPTSTAEQYTGYIRVGGDNLNGWPSQPISAYFTGTIDEVAYYPIALRADQVAQHYNLR